MRDSISKTNINKFTKDFKSSATSNITRNALVRSNINDVAMDWDGFRLLDHTYSDVISTCLLYTSPSPRDRTRSRMPSSA